MGRVYKFGINSPEQHFQFANEIEIAAGIYGLSLPENPNMFTPFHLLLLLKHDLQIIYYFEIIIFVSGLEGEGE